ncbi:unnamed protein product [Brassicogethes aeneus]|uniref:C2H2-type domain-containing protein n=1 Tax=Brassicogethes aeneus TaxID=1431903 RepID=A0A9P0BKC6_BRAAE|nr:unnamed protein product [Brassicogethes aeneus]
MEKIFFKTEPGDILMNYDEPSTPADPSTSGIAIKQEIKEELYDSDNFMDYNKSGVKEESETFIDEEDDFDVPEQVKIKFESEDVMFLDKRTNSEVNKGILAKAEIGKNPESKINQENFESVYECKKCLIKFFRKELLESHNEKCLKSRLKVSKFKCEICSKNFQRKYGLLQHKKFVHKKEEQEQFKCGKCEYQTSYKSNFNSHLKIHDTLKNLKCHFCQYRAAALQTLNSHILSKHNKEENKIKITSKIHECTKCSYSTVIKTHYDRHVKVCLKLKNVEWYECEVCSYSTIYKFHLISQMKTHSKIKELRCLFCQYECSKKTNLDNHILRKHSDLLNKSNENIITSKVHCCQHCKYKTTTTSHLKFHLKNNH